MKFSFLNQPPHLLDERILQIICMLKFFVSRMAWPRKRYHWRARSIPSILNDDDPALILLILKVILAILANDFQ